jgi:hypothetical protein
VQRHAEDGERGARQPAAADDQPAQQRQAQPVLGRDLARVVGLQDDGAVVARRRGGGREHPEDGVARHRHKDGGSGP